MLMAQSPGAIQQRYRNRMVEVSKDKDGNPKMGKLGTWWLDHPQRRQYKQLIFAPQKVIPNAYNLWQGFACESLSTGNCDLLMHHVFHNICSKNEEHYNYLLNWMARAVQFPGLAGEVAIAMKGGRGTGKTFLADEFASMFGRHGMKITDPRHLIGNFNAHLQDLCVLFADEAFWAGDKKHEGVLKSIITSNTLTIELKGYDAKVCRNCIHLMMASNEEWVVPAGQDERRFFVLEVGEESKQNVDYFGAIAKQQAKGGREALLYFLQNRDIKDFRVQEVPQTEALKEQKIYSQAPMEQWWYGKLRDGYITAGADHDWPALFECEKLVDSFINTTKKFNIGTRRGSDTLVGKFINLMLTPSRGCGPCELTKVQRTVVRKVPDLDGAIQEVKQRGVRFFVLPDLARCRELWELRFGETHWPEPVQHDTTQKPGERAF
jgi:hypothetical protein